MAFEEHLKRQQLPLFPVTFQRLQAHSSEHVVPHDQTEDRVTIPHRLGHPGHVTQEELVHAAVRRGQPLPRLLSLAQQVNLQNCMCYLHVMLSMVVCRVYTLHEEGYEMSQNGIFFSFVVCLCNCPTTNITVCKCRQCLFCCRDTSMKHKNQKHKNLLLNIFLVFVFCLFVCAVVVFSQKKTHIMNILPCPHMVP